MDVFCERHIPHCGACKVKDTLTFYLRGRSLFKSLETKYSITFSLQQRNASYLRFEGFERGALLYRPLTQPRFELISDKYPGLPILTSYSKKYTGLVIWETREDLRVKTKFTLVSLCLIKRDKNASFTVCMYLQAIPYTCVYYFGMISNSKITQLFQNLKYRIPSIFRRGVIRLGG